MTDEVRITDWGTRLVVPITDNGNIVDVSANTGITFIFIKPNAVKVEKTGVLDTNGVDGRVAYVFQTGDLDSLGKWSFQVKVDFLGGSWHTTIGSFKVTKIL